MSAVTGGERILLSGPPHNTKAVIRVETPGDTAVTVRVDIAGESSIHTAQIRPFGRGATEMRLRLPRDTPPGRYAGVVMMGDAKYPVAVDVSAAPRTRIAPKKLALAVEPGSRAEFELVVTNGGNVPVDIPKSAAFDLDDGEAQDRALGLTLRAKLDEDETRMDRWFEELRHTHGGEARISVVDGGGPLEPQESRPVKCRIEIPMTTEPGRTYIGSWIVGSTSHILAVTVQTPAMPRTGRQRNGGRKE